MKHRSLRNSQVAGLGLVALVVGWIAGRAGTNPGPSLGIIIGCILGIFVLIWIGDVLNRGRKNVYARWFGLLLLLFGPSEKRKVQVKRTRG